MNLDTSRTHPPGLQATCRIAMCCVALFALTFDAIAQRSPDQLRPVSASDPRLGGLFFENVKGLVREWYYDPNFNGLEIEKSYATADNKLRSMTGIGQMFTTISDALMEFDDPHTYLLPPVRELEPEYGFTSMMVGDSCLVTSVKQGSSAETRGLRVGDRIDLFGAVPPTRRSHWKIKLMLYAVSPLPALKLDVTGVDGKSRQIEIETAFVSGKEREQNVQRILDKEISEPFVCKDLSTELSVCKVHTFAVKKEAFAPLYKYIASKKKLILDFRGNRDWFEETFLDFAGHFFSKDLIAFKARRRKKEKDVVIRGRSDAFSGELAIIQNSETGGASEILAKVSQLEVRGKVYGDVSSGSAAAFEVLIVQVPRFMGQQPGMDILTLLGVSISEPIMRDGSRLARIGVVPDDPLGPSGYAIRERLDPILSHVAIKMGSQLSPKLAGETGFMSPRNVEMVDVPRKPTRNQVESTPTVINW